MLVLIGLFLPTRISVTQGGMLELSSPRTLIRRCSERVVILERLKLRILTYNCEMTAMLIMLLMVPFTVYKPALASHPYWTTVIDGFLSFGAIE